MARLAEEKIKEIERDYMENKMVKNKEPFAYEKLLLDAQIEAIRQQSGMKLIEHKNDPDEYPNGWTQHEREDYLIGFVIGHDDGAKAQLAQDQLVIDKRVAELEALMIMAIRRNFPCIPDLSGQDCHWYDTLRDCNKCPNIEKFIEDINKTYKALQEKG